MTDTLPAGVPSEGRPEPMRCWATVVRPAFMGLPIAVSCDATEGLDGTGLCPEHARSMRDQA